MAQQFIALIIILSMALQPMHGVSAASQENQPPSATEALAGTLKTAATHGFFPDLADYDETLAGLEKLQGRDPQQDDFTDEERQLLIKTLDAVQKRIPGWIDQIIADGKKLQADGIVPFESPNWEGVTTQCKDMAVDAKGPFGQFIDGLEQLKTRKSIDWQAIHQNIERQSLDCFKHLRTILQEVEQIAQQLDAELKQLADDIKEKKKECDAKEGEAKDACNKDLDTLYQKAKEKYEERQKVERFKNKSKFTKAMLGYLAIAAGLTLGIVCCPNLGASIAAWGGSTLQDNQDWQEDRTTKYKELVGQERSIPSDANTPAVGEQKALIEQMQQKNFETVPVTNASGDIPFEIFKSAKEIRIYLVKDHRLIAYIKQDNLRILPNKIGLHDIAGIQALCVDGGFMNGAKEIQLNAFVTVNGQEYQASILETESLSNVYSLTING